MDLKPIESDEKSIWQMIQRWAQAKGLNAEGLSRFTSYPLLRIRKGFNGEDATITDNFLRNCVIVFGLASGRIDTKHPEDISQQLSREECIRLLSTPPPVST